MPEIKKIGNSLQFTLNSLLFDIRLRLLQAHDDESVSLPVLNHTSQLPMWYFHQTAYQITVTALTLLTL